MEKQLVSLSALVVAFLCLTPDVHAQTTTQILFQVFNLNKTFRTQLNTYV
jgi:alpha-amylase